MTISGAAVRGRVIGSLVAVVIGFGWWLFAVRGLPLALAIAAGVLGAAVVVQLFRMSRRAMRSAAGGGGGRRFPALGFGLLVVAEIAGMNVAAWLLRAPELQRYLLPAISLAVGLHFIPMLWLFRRPELPVCGAAMIGAAGVVAVALGLGAPVEAATALEAAVNAAILWATAAYSLGRIRAA